MTDVELAAAVAEEAGALLLALRRRGEGKALGKLGDRRSDDLIGARLRAARPDDRILSEESADDHARLDAERVWIVDPLDGTREYGLEGRADWAVHVALWQRGRGITDAAVAQPALGATYTSATRRAGREERRTVDPRQRQPPAGLGRGGGGGARRAAAADGLGRRQGDGGAARRARCLRARRRPVGMGLRRARRRRPRARPARVADRRRAARVQPRAPLPAGPRDLPPGTGRSRCWPRSLMAVCQARRTSSACLPANEGSSASGCSPSPLSSNQPMPPNQSLPWKARNAAS